ncbi:MAG: hypothetical protein EBR67_04915 [Proteobacteria bacterium]|nr:hypothetical protein [Pseudomonadota bacterium]
MKKTNDINLTLWQGSDLVDYYEFDNIIKSIPIYLSIPDFSFSRKGFQLFDKLSNDYKNWILNQQSFAIKILITDKSGDSIEQIFFFQNDQNC